VAALVIASCGSDYDPYADLSADASQFVIPDAKDWNADKRCPSGGDCPGVVTADSIERFDWFSITGLEVATDLDQEKTVHAILVVSESRPASATTTGSLQVRVWGPVVDDVERALESGYEVWVGIPPESNYVSVFSAFDSGGRFAGVGRTAADYFTVPVARLAAEADAESGFAFLDPLMAK
jgi:hypothetical protein